MFRGEFIRGDGLVIPNNVTKVGARTLLAAALRNTVPVFTVGLVNAQPDPDLTLSDMVEPSVAGGYARKPVTRDEAGWPVMGELNGEPYFETAPLVWEATAAYSESVRRLALFNGNDVLALSGAMPNDLLIDENTNLPNRTFKYRLYAR